MVSGNPLYLRIERARNTHMLATTLEIIRAGLKCDPTLSPDQRTQLIALLRKGPSPVAPPAPPRLLRRNDVAERLNVSLRAVDKMAKEGVLKRVVLPGRKQGAGFLESQVNALLLSEGPDGEGGDCKPVV